MSCKSLVRSRGSNITGEKYAALEYKKGTVTMGEDVIGKSDHRRFFSASARAEGNVCELPACVW